MSVRVYARVLLETKMCWATIVTESCVGGWANTQCVSDSIIESDRASREAALPEGGLIAGYRAYGPWWPFTAWPRPFFGHTIWRSRVTQVLLMPTNFHFSLIFDRDRNTGSPSNCGSPVTVLVVYLAVAIPARVSTLQQRPSQHTTALVVVAVAAVVVVVVVVAVVVVVVVVVAVVFVVVVVNVVVVVVDVDVVVVDRRIVTSGRSEQQGRTIGVDGCRHGSRVSRLRHHPQPNVKAARKKQLP